MNVDFEIEITKDDASKQELPFLQMKAEIKDEPNDGSDENITWPRDNDFNIKCEPIENSNIVLYDQIFIDSSKLEEHLEAPSTSCENVKKLDVTNHGKDGDKRRTVDKVKYKKQFNKGSRKRNAPLAYLAQIHELKYKFLADRLKVEYQFKKQELTINKEKLILEREMVLQGLQIQEERLNLEREKVDARIRLEEKRKQEEIRLKKLEIERNRQLEQFEMELKLKQIAK